MPTLLTFRILKSIKMPFFEYYKKERCYIPMSYPHEKYIAVW